MEVAMDETKIAYAYAYAVNEGVRKGLMALSRKLPHPPQHDQEFIPGRVYGVKTPVGTLPEVPSGWVAIRLSKWENRDWALVQCADGRIGKPLPCKKLQAQS